MVVYALYVAESDVLALAAWHFPERKAKKSSKRNREARIERPEELPLASAAEGKCAGEINNAKAIFLRRKHIIYCE